MNESINERERAQIELCKMWINKFTIPTVNFRHNRSSYNYKHYVERHYYTYISNHSFLVAVKELKLDRLPDKDISQYCYFKFRIVPTYIKIPKYDGWDLPESILKMELSEKNSDND